MAKQTIFLGNQANDGTGDSLRVAFDKVNDNFDDVYTSINAISENQQINADWNATEGISEILNKPTLFSGDYADLVNKPTIIKIAPQWTSNHYQMVGGVNTRYLVNDVVYDNGSVFVAKFDNESLPTTNNQYWENIGSGYRINIDGRDIPNITYSQLTGKPTLFSGSYNDLTNKPQIPLIVEEPQSSIGQEGDTVGLYSYSTAYFYYCSGEYDGETHIWKRVAWDNQVW